MRHIYSEEEKQFLIDNVKGISLIELTKRFNKKFSLWDKYKEIPLKEIYLCVGSWRLGMAGIFCSSFRDSYGDYCFDDFLIDWKSPVNLQYAQKRQVDKFIQIMDKYRDDIRISRKKYEDF